MNRRYALKNLLVGSGTLLASRFGVLTASAQSTAETVSSPSGRMVFDFDFDWRFRTGDSVGAEALEHDDISWRVLDLPHDWSIEGPFQEDQPSGMAGGFAPTGIGWYRKTFGIPSTMRGKRILIDFEGVYQNSEVWINGASLGKQHYGYSGFRYDLTPYIRFDKSNVLAVRVNNSVTHSRWYSGSGIYRHVRLLIAENLHVGHWGTYVRTPVVNSSFAQVDITTSVVNFGEDPRECEIRTTILDNEGEPVASAVSEVVELPAGWKMEFDQQLRFASPRLWSPSHPSLYLARTEVISYGSCVDEYFTPFGVRHIRFDPEAGLLLNGESIKMKGVCLHQDLGGLGAAALDRGFERRLEILKSIGCNAIRTSHNPPAAAFLDACDRLGFLVIDEAFDKWSIGVFPDLESPYFSSFWQRDLRAMLQRDRNHPSVVIWSVGNEAGYPGSDAHDGMLKQLVDFVHSEEPSRPVTCALVPVDGSVSSVLDRVLKSGSHMDLLSLNYQEAYYPYIRSQRPDAVIVGTEAAPFFGRTIGSPEASAVNPWFSAAGSRFVIGHFVWNGFDYLGESFVWPSRGWAAGLVDTCGFPKGQAYFFQSAWSSEPVVRVLVIDPELETDPVVPYWFSPPYVSHWNFSGRPAQTLMVHTPSNCDTVELLLNGHSLGTQRPADSPNQTIVWYVPNLPGALVAIGRNKGELVAGHGVRTSGAPAAIQLRPDRASVKADGQDLSHIEVAIVDSEGITVPDSDTLVTFEVNGGGKLAAVDDGRLRSLEPYQGNTRLTRLGKCLLVVRAGRQAGRIAITANGGSLPSASIELDVHS